MTSRFRRRLACLVTWMVLLALVPAEAREPAHPADPAIVIPSAASPWQFSTGVTVRSISADFHMDAPAPLNPRLFYSPRGALGPGDVGVATRPGDQIFYDDGYVGTDDTFFGSGGVFTDGNAALLVQSASQFTPAQTVPGPGTGTLIVPGEVNFHSHGTTFSYLSTYQGDDLNHEDSDTGVGPYVSLRRSLGQFGSSEVGISLGWSWVDASFAAGPQITARQVISEVQRDSAYTYSYETLMTLLFGPPGTRIGSGALAGVIYNASAGNNAYGAVLAEPLTGPSSSRSDRFATRTLAVLEAVSQAHLDLDLHDAGFLVDWTFWPCSWCSIALATGPTVNVLDYDFRTRTDWFLNGSRIATLRQQDSGSEVKAGARIQAMVTCSLNRRGTCFLEFGGGYDWVDTATLTLGGARVEIDASSWTARCGLGIRF